MTKDEGRITERMQASKSSESVARGSSSTLATARPRLGTRIMGVLRVLIARIPPAIGYKVADFAGNITYYIAPRSRQAAISNLRHIMRGASRKDVMTAVRKVFHNVMRNYYDLCRAPDMSDDELETRVVFDREGWKRVLELQSQKKGVLLVGAHFGSFDMISQVIHRRGVDLAVLIAQVKPAWLSDWITGMRAARGLQLLMVDTEEREGSEGTNMSALLEGMRQLRSGGVLGVVVDRNTEETGVVIPFFGHKTRVAAGAAKMALRTRAHVVLGLCRRLPGNRFSVTFGEPIAPQGSAGNEDDVRALLTEIFSRLEKHFRLSPEQWVLLQPVWPKDG
jgi:KDO2-lipid IV(A) lauroyltransferase